jgi:hypothetical protein
MQKRNDRIAPSGSGRFAQLDFDIAFEGLRQARDSFTLAKRSFQLHMLMTTACGCVGLFGVGLMLYGREASGAATTTGGVASSVVFSQMSKSAREQLEKANARLDTIRDDLSDTELTLLFTPALKEIQANCKE